MQVKSKKTGEIRTITADWWARIVENGFASEFEQLPDAPMPQEVAERFVEPDQDAENTDTEPTQKTHKKKH